MKGVIDMRLIRFIKKRTEFSLPVGDTFRIGAYLGYCITEVFGWYIVFDSKYGDNKFLKIIDKL